MEMPHTAKQFYRISFAIAAIVSFSLTPASCIAATSTAANPMQRMSAGDAVATRSVAARNSDPGKLEGVIILSRHGNRPPLKDKATLDRETSNSWPVWNTPPGHLTPRGRQLVVGMGSYYRDRFIREGLLTGNDAEDVKHAWFHTNTIQRTIQTGCALAEGMFPTTTTTVHYLVDNKKDALFYGGPIDMEMSSATMHGRMGNNVAALARSMDPQFKILETFLAKPGLYGRNLSSISLAAAMADNFMCEYCEGMEGEQFAFGRGTAGELREALKMLALDFDLQVRTPYLARTRMSNMVSHMLATLQQMAGGKAVPGAFGDADNKIHVIVGHDTTLSSVAGLLGLDWVLPDTGRNLCPAGGAIIFELRSRTQSDHSAQFVRVYYAAQTLEQMHNNVKASPENPPAIAPIFVPGSSKPDLWYDSPLEDFLANASRLVDPALVYPVDDGPAQ